MTWGDVGGTWGGVGGEEGSGAGGGRGLGAVAFPHPHPEPYLFYYHGGAIIHKAWLHFQQALLPRGVCSVHLPPTVYAGPASPGLNLSPSGSLGTLVLGLSTSSPTKVKRQRLKSLVSPSMSHVWGTPVGFKGLQGEAAPHQPSLSVTLLVLDR